MDLRAQARRRVLGCAGLLLSVLFALAAAPPETFHFVLLGDRTGETAPGVYERVWHDAAAGNPAFVLSAGDTIQGLNDATAADEWQKAEQILLPYRKFPLYLTPGNHDIWSRPSERLFRTYAGHPPHYSFDYQQAHFTILDNSRTEQFSADELQFLEKDLQEHAVQTVKFIVSHRPSWLIDAALANPQFTFHQLAKKYGVKYVVAGHLHQMLHVDLEDVAYVSLPSAGGQLRASMQYDDGWFFGHTMVEVHGASVSFQIFEVKPPYGQGRTSSLRDWGKLGRLKAAAR
jgi:3',5'-cyclic-AMP phosphodiesterase